MCVAMYLYEYKFKTVIALFIKGYCSCIADDKSTVRTVCAGPSTPPCLCSYKSCRVSYSQDTPDSFYIYSAIIPLILVMVMCVD